MGTRGKGEQGGNEGEQGEGMLYCFKVPTTSVGQGVRAARGSEGGEGDRGGQGEGMLYCFKVPPHLWGKEQGERGGARGVRG